MPFDSATHDFNDDVLRCLQDARQWLSDPGHWCKDAFGISALGLPLHDRPSVVKRAAQTCARGAVALCSANSTNMLDAYTALDAVIGHPTPKLNDAPETTHADILALFDLAIEARRAELFAASPVSTAALQHG